MTVTIIHFIYDDFHYNVNSYHKINNKIEQNRVVLVIMSSYDSMPEYHRHEADRCHTIGSYMNRCHCESFFSINLNRSNHDIEEESLEETVIESNTCIYDSNDISILQIGDTVMNIGNVMESGIIVAFDNERNNVLMRVDRIETNVVSMNKVRYVHANNPTLINTLACS